MAQRTDHRLTSEVIQNVLDSKSPTGAAKVLELEINSQEKLETFATLTITKACEDSSKHSFLAQLCKLTGSLKVKWVEDGLAKETDFKRELLLRCQSELKGVKKEEDELFRMSEAIAASPEKTRLESEYLEFESRTRQRTLCLFRFFGELFRVKMIPENVMHECLVRLLQSTTDSEYLECFCVLITICGEYLDHSKAKARMDRYFERIDYILKRGKVSLQVKMMLQKVQDLRSNNWTKRELNKAECRWVRSDKALATMFQEERETAILFGKFRAILNKITRRKFQQLAEQALTLEINTEKRLQGCVDMIFTRILRPKERFFRIVYVNLCKVMSPLKVEWEEEGKMKQTNFRRELLTKCQVEFERDKKDEEEHDRMTKAIKEAASLEEKKQLEDELTEFMAKSQERSISNMLFIGELFKLSMLSETIIHECIVRLLKSTSDDRALECFTKLIRTAGRELDTLRAKTRMDGHFTRVAGIIKKGTISTRTKFMLQDIQELRENDWVPLHAHSD